MAIGTSSTSRNVRKSSSTKTGAEAPRDAGAAAPRDAGAALIDPGHRRALIAEAAYYRAERRGFAPGREADDWYAAEVEVDTALTIGVPSSINPVQ